MTSLTKKPKGLKRSGVSNKYIVVNKNNWSKFVNELFQETSWYYLTIIFNGKGYKVNMILWKDEINSSCKLPSKSSQVAFILLYLGTRS